MHNQLPAIAILCRYYGTVKDICTYLSEILESSPVKNNKYTGFLPTESDPASYHHLLRSAYIGINSLQRNDFQYEEPGVGMDGTIKRAQELLFQTKSTKKNILKAGYCPKKGGGGLHNYSVNTIVTALLGPEWEILLRRIGTAAMLHLLVDASVFCLLPNGCLCQMTGEPLQNAFLMRTTFSTEPKSDLKRSNCHLEPSTDARPTKRTKLMATNSKSGVQRQFTVKKPASISMVRVRMFYARPNRIPKTNQIVVGLPLRHVFNLHNRNGSYYIRQEQVTCSPHNEPDPTEHALWTRHTLRYIFPRQSGLSNPFQAHAFDNGEYRDYTDREEEIRRAAKLNKHHNTPKRLKDIVPLVDKMLWRHKKCPYQLIMDKLCRSKISSEDENKPDESMILEWMSERSILLQTQPYISVDTSLLSVDNNLSSSANHTTPKPRFAEFACPYNEVYRYVVIITKAIIPKSFWGSRKNFRVVMHHVKSFITGRQHETLSLHHVLQNFSTSDCDWLMPPGAGAKQQHRVSVSDAMKRRELLEEFLFWFFDSFVSPLIKTCFYVTESSAFRNRVLYFRQDDWDVLCAPLISKLKSATFSEVPENEALEIMRQRQLGFSFVRLLPKETGIRPIINLRRKSNGHGNSINQVLQIAFHILTYEKRTRPELVGASVTNADDFYRRLKDFKQRITSPGPSTKLPKLYFVKVDVQACFDTIDQGKLLQIIKELISEDSYTVRKYAQVRLSGQRVHKIYSKIAYPTDNDPQFLDMAMELANLLRHTIFVDQTPPSVDTRRHILQLLNSHITDNIVKIGNRYYRQVIGIPQGSILSSLLCAFFYGDLEKRLGTHLESQNSTVFRMVDDYLFITTDFEKANAFLDMMNKGHPEYGCFISQEKTMTNFDYDHQVLNVTDRRSRNFFWCGYAIDMEDLSVSVDYTRYQGADLANTITVARGRNPGAFFVSKMLFLARYRTHIIWTDMDLNRKKVVYLNIYQNFVLCAMKMHCYLRDWGLKCQEKMPFIRDTIKKMIICSFSSLISQTKRPVAKSGKYQAPCFVQKSEVWWLGIYAFHHVLSSKPTQYKFLLRWLKIELKSSGYRNCRNKFGEVVKDGLTSMENIRY